MASYDEALQKMYSDRLTRFYRNYDEAKVASVPKPCGNQKQPVARANAERRLASMAYQLYHTPRPPPSPERAPDTARRWREAGPASRRWRSGWPASTPRRRRREDDREMEREKSEQEVSRDVDDREKVRERDVLQTETQP